MFNTSISGLNGSQKYLDTTSNNIANANSYGFKKSRAEFADLYTNSVFTSTKTATGMGVTTTTVAQQFAQGSLSGDTGNNLDMAISGNGFFVLANEPNGSATANVGDRTYTRNGAFEINSEGYIITAMGDYLQGYNIDKDGNVSNLDISSTSAIKIPETTGAPKQSSTASLVANIPSGADALGTSTTSAMAKFDPNDSETYTNATSQTIYDSLGGAHTLTYYFQKNHTTEATDTPANATVWNVVAYCDGNPVDMADVSDTDKAVEFNVTDASSSISGTTLYGMTMTFGSDGQLISGEQHPSAINLNNNTSTYPARTGRTDYTLASAMGGGVADNQNVNITMDLTQYGSSKFTVSNITTDGYATGLLQNVQVDEDGIIVASYSNGRTENIAKVAMANFTNPQGLIKVGDTQWKESISSGQAQASQANTGMTGAIKGANLELSNVELASELVDLIIAQRTYQANAQALQTQNTAMDAVMNIR